MENSLGHKSPAFLYIFICIRVGRGGGGLIFSYRPVEKLGKGGMKLTYFFFRGSEFLMKFLSDPGQKSLRYFSKFGNFVLEFLVCENCTLFSH